MRMRFISNELNFSFVWAHVQHLKLQFLFYMLKDGNLNICMYIYSSHGHVCEIKGGTHPFQRHSSNRVSAAVKRGRWGGGGGRCLVTRRMIHHVTSDSRQSSISRVWQSASYLTFSFFKVHTKSHEEERQDESIDVLLQHTMLPVSSSCSFSPC